MPLMRVFLLVFTGLAVSPIASGMQKSCQAEEIKRSTQPFPIAVWLQSPRNAERYKRAGINTYVGLWRGPTEEQLQALRSSGMRVICAQNAVGLRHRDDSNIVAWMHDDEPDNAQAKPDGKGYGPPIEPARIVEKYQRMKQQDPSRPVLLNMGQGVAWDNYIGRGVRRNHPEDYPEYIRGCDIASFDIYPAVHDHPDVAGKLWFVAEGVKRLRQWAGPDRTVWNCIEASRISNEKTKPTGPQIKAEVWMSIIHGSRGIIYFVHQFKPRFVEASLLEDETLLAEVTRINAQLQQLAPVILAPETDTKIQVGSSDPAAPIATLIRSVDGVTYVFAVAMRDQPAELRLSGLPAAATTIEVLDESRTLPVQAGAATDQFAPYDVHVYRIR